MSASKNYYRIMLGKKSDVAQQCHKEQWFGGGWKIEDDLTDRLPDNMREFNKDLTPVYLDANPGKNKASASSCCGMLWRICKGIQRDDIALCHDGTGKYWIGEVIGDYFYVPDTSLPHRRKVRWYPDSIARSDMSEGLRNRTGLPGTVRNVTKHAEEIEKLLGGNALPKLIATDELVEDPSVFALETHLEEFLVQNWQITELGRNYEIFEEDGELVGQQYQTDTGPIDILAISKDKKELLVVELKRGRASDTVVGQTQRYMGYVSEELAEESQSVKGCIIALEDDLKLRRALSVTPNIDFFRYQMSFKLFKN